jgi:hypothetical protein
MELLLVMAAATVLMMVLAFLALTQEDRALARDDLALGRDEVRSS